MRINDIVGVIPVRKDSQRVKNKNLRSFADSNLLIIKIKQLKKLGLRKIIVNTDSDLAIRIAIDCDVDYHMRDKYFASSECSGSEYFEHIAKVTDAENILLAPVTAPLISINSYEKAINEYFSSNCNSLMSIKVIQEFLWFNGTPINYDLKSAPNSQELPKYFTPTFGIIIANRMAMLESKNVICSNPHFYEITQEESIDIDTELDFEFAEFLYKKVVKNEQ